MKFLVNLQGLMKEYRSAVNTKDLERQYMLESRIFNTETPEFLEINPHFHGQPGFGLKDTWPPFGRGARLALFMMELSNQMGGTATFLDFIQMLEVCPSSNDSLPINYISVLNAFDGQLAARRIDSMASRLLSEAFLCNA